MSDLDAILIAVDQLDTTDLFKLRHYVEEKTRVVIYTLTPEQLAAIDELFRPVQEAAADMSDEEIDAAIADAVMEVRRERQTKSGD
jgi:hypothetical protein